MRTEIHTALNCYRACTETIRHCLEMGNEHAESSHINILKDCANICLTLADFMMRDSDHHRKLAPICAEICEACADSCEEIDEDDEQMQHCADLCRQCAEMCRQID